MRKKVIVFIVSALLWSSTQLAQAFVLNFQYDGNLNLQGQSLVATFTQTFNSLFYSYRLDIDTTGLLPGEFVTSCFFNIAAPEPFPPLGPPVGIPGAHITTPAGYLSFDWSIAFDSAGLSAGNTYSYSDIVNSLSPLPTGLFDAVNGLNGDYYAAAFITSSQGTGYIADSATQEPQPSPVPEPSTMILLGIGLAGLTELGRKKLL